MGREIRRVPANWEHPKYTEDTASRNADVGVYIPLQDNHEQALEKFAADIKAKGLKKAIDHWGGGPRTEEYADYGGRERTWWQVYETVSEGTPVSPPFATREELIEYLVKHGDFWGQGAKPYSRAAAEAFVKENGWAPSMMMAGGVLKEGVEGLIL